MKTHVFACLSLFLIGVISIRQLTGQQPAPMANSPAAFAPHVNAAPTVDAGLASLISAAPFCAAFNRGDAKALADLWTPTGEYVDEAGERFVGRDAIAAEYAKLFAAQPGIQIRIHIDSLRLLSEDTAIEDGQSTTEPTPPGAPAINKYTAIHVKQNGVWLMATVRDFSVKTVSPYNHLQDLEWLIGSWQAEELGSTIITTFSWGANKSFIERTYSVSKDDGIYKDSGKQIIAWDPRTRRIQSWTFSSDGGRAEGVWKPRDGGWSCSTVGVLPNGVETSAVNSFTRLDDNGMVWQSTQRMSGGAALPDPEEVVMRRIGGRP